MKNKSIITKTAEIIISLVLGIVFILLLIKIVLIEELPFQEQKTMFKLEKCYKLKMERDPFEKKKPIIIKIKDKKKGWVLFNFSSTPQERFEVTEKIEEMENIFKEVSCNEYENNKELEVK